MLVYLYRKKSSPPQKKKKMHSRPVVCMIVVADSLGMFDWSTLVQGKSGFDLSGYLLKRHVTTMCLCTIKLLPICGDPYE